MGVTDPSSRHVSHGGADLHRQVDAIRIVAAALHAGRWRSWPATGAARDVAAFTWATWDEPRFEARRRPVFDAMRDVYSEMSRATPHRAANR
jgi:hypothetical protein